MNQEIKTKWLKALRSGEYKQGKGFLNTAEGFCCLGVLCDVYVKETNSKWTPHSGPNGVASFEGERSLIPTAVAIWSEIDSENPAIPIELVEPAITRSTEFFPSETMTLALLNDKFGFTFDQIANLVEKHL